MALATLCPHCHTIFRVANDQLKLRSGLVRCGACKQIFNGIEHLLRPDQVPAPQPTPSTVAASVDSTPIAAAPVKDIAVVAPAITAATIQMAPSEVRPAQAFSAGESAPFETPGSLPVAPPPDAQAFPAAPIYFAATDLSAPEHPAAVPPPHTQFAPAASENPPVDAPAMDDSLPSLAPIDFSQLEPDVDLAAFGAEGAIQSVVHPAHVEEDDGAVLSLAEEAPDAFDDEIGEATDASDHPPTYVPLSALHASSDAHSAEEPSFVIRGRRLQRIARVTRILMWAGSLILLLGLIGQSAYAFRNQLAAWFPQAKPVLNEFCSVVHCKMHLLSQIDAVTIESSELQALAPNKNTFALTLLLRNYSTTTQAWPSIELTLNDSNEKAIARRVFAQKDYLPGQDGSKGFAPNSEQPLKISFELLQLKAAGYRVYLFYP